MKRAAALLLAAAAMLLPAVPAPAAPTSETGPALEPLPEVRQEAAEPRVLDQLRDARADAEALAAGVLRGEVEPGAAAAAFGRVGQLFAAYDLFPLARAAFANARTLAPETFRWRYYAAYAAQEAGDLPAAEEALERALELRPDDLPSLLRLGDVLLADRPAEAEEVFRRALEVQPTAAAGHAGLGRIAAAAGRPAEAVEQLGRALELQPSADRLHYPMALALRDAGDPEAARRHLALRGDTAVTAPDPLVEELGGLATGGAFHLVRGDTAMLEGRVADAVEEYRRAVAADPERFAFRKALAVALYNRRHLEAAEEELRRTLALEPVGPEARRRSERAEVRTTLGTLLVHRQRPAEAEEELRAALALDPEHPGARLALADLLGRSGRVDEAFGQLSRLLEHHPNHRAGRMKRATGRMELGRFEEALPDLERLVRDDPGDATAQARLGAALEGAGREEEALAAYRRTLEIEDGARGPRAFAHLRTARILEARGRHGEALERWRTFLDEQPRHRAAHFGLASALVRAGRYGEARERLERSLQELKGDFLLAQLFARLLAAAPEPAVRDPERAVTVARRLHEMLGGASHAATLAMALAEAGRFEEAVELQRGAIRRAEEKGAVDPLPTLRAQLERYRRGLPWRHTPGEGLLPAPDSDG